MAPELLAGFTDASKYKITFEQDVWSLAVVLYAVLFADLPWSSACMDDIDFPSFAESGITDHHAPWCLLAKPMRDVMRKLLSVSPHRRPSMADVAAFFALKPPWLTDEAFTEDHV